MKTNHWIVIGIIIIIVLVGLIMGNKNKSVKKTAEKPSGTSSNAAMPAKRSGVPTPALEIAKGKTYTAILSTDKGDITIEFDSENTPITTNNFVTLSRKKFYDGTIFHRVIEGFMIQGGDTLGNGTGDPGYKFDDEDFEGEYTRGTVAMANSGPNTNGSQFFIMHQDTPLPPNYVIFGKVTKGMDVVDAIATAPVESGSFGEASTPEDPVTIETVEIIEK